MTIGTPGYIQYNKIQTLLKTGIGSISFIIIYVVGILIIGDNRSYFTILAALIILPTAQFAAKFFAYRGHYSVQSDLVTSTDLSGYVKLYELLLVRGKSTYFIDVIMIGQDTVFLLCLPNKKHMVDHNKVRQSVQSMLNQKGIVATVLSYNKEESYLEAIDVYSEIPNSQQENQQEGIAKTLRQSGM